MMTPMSGIRATAMVLCGACLFLAVGDTFQARADFHFKQGNYEKAAAFSQQSLHYDRDNAKSLTLLGLSSWNSWLKTKGPKALERASHAFETLTRDHANDAKGWFYKALSERQRLLGQGALTEQDRLKINQALNKAQMLEPHSPWGMIFTSLEVLENTPKNIRAKQEDFFLRRIQWALGQHYIDQVSPYLEDVYRRLLKMGYDASVLRRVTPKEARSYFHLLEFYKLNRHYQAYSKLEGSYETLNRKYYNRLCDQADDWLERGDTRRAQAAYRFAQRQRPLGARARAGQFASAVDSQTGAPDAFKTLETLLTQEEEDLNFYWDYLSSGVEASQNNFMEGLFYFRRRQYSAAVKSLKKVEAERSKTARRFLAQALIESDHLEQAKQILSPLLEEDQPDLRELFLLERLADTDSKVEIQAKIQRAVTRKISNPAWWSETAGARSLLAEGEFSGVSANLQSGRVRVAILLKLESGFSARLARVRVWENDREQFSGSAVVTQDWQRQTLEFETTGGWRWIQVVLEKENLPKREQAADVRLRLGSIQLDYPE